MDITETTIEQIVKAMQERITRTADVRDSSALTRRVMGAIIASGDSEKFADAMKGAA
jgi:hypothetical protein